MRKDSAYIFLVSLVVSVGLIGLASYSHYWNKANDNKTWIGSGEQPTSASRSSPPTIENGAASTNQPTDLPRKFAPRRTDTPLECEHTDGSTFWTNAATCEGADLNSRMSFSDEVETPRLDRRKKEERTTTRSRRASSRPRKPNLRAPGRSPPADTPQRCRFAIGRALEIEKPLSAAKDPAESIWRESYCRWVKEARLEKCDTGPSVLYYWNLCPG